MSEIKRADVSLEAGGEVLQLGRGRRSGVEHEEIDSRLL